MVLHGRSRPGCSTADNASAAIGTAAARHRVLRLRPRARRRMLMSRSIRCIALLVVVHVLALTYLIWLVACRCPGAAAMAGDR